MISTEPNSIRALTLPTAYCTGNVSEMCINRPTTYTRSSQPVARCTSTIPVSAASIDATTIQFPRQFVQFGNHKLNAYNSAN